MNIALPAEIQDFVDRQVNSGKYADPPTLILAALQLLQQQENIYQGRLLELQQEALIGWDALQNGEVQDGETAIAEIREHLHQKT